MDRAQLADFLRTRREALHPEDVGLPRGQRRRTGGLRREEVAVLFPMSTDYYSRLEQQRGHPTLRADAQRDHLFRLAGRNTPQRALGSDHVNPGLMRILDRLSDTPAEVITGLAEIPQLPEPFARRQQFLDQGPDPAIAGVSAVNPAEVGHERRLEGVDTARPADDAPLAVAQARPGEV
jgi:hypothetical protein